MIELRNISKIFHTASGDVNALTDISIHIEKGDIFGIIGLSGAGKSTLVRCINLLEQPSSGSVLFCGTDLVTLPKKELLKQRKKISMVFQNFNLLAQRTALKNVCYPMEISGVPKKQAEEKALSLLKLVGLEDKKSAYPAQLSGGQKQRVAIARALATDPEVLLCDEATSALDPNTTHAILELLKQINRELGVTIVVITHEMKVVEQICNKVAVLDDSRMVETGYVDEVFLAPKAQITKELVLPKNTAVQQMLSGEILRVVLDGQSVYEPLLANMIIECHTTVSILAADIKNADGASVGQMLLQLPEDAAAIQRIEKYLTDKKITYEKLGTV